MDFSGPEIKIPGPIISIRGLPFFILKICCVTSVLEGKTAVQAGLLTSPPFSGLPILDSLRQWHTKAEEVPSSGFKEGGFTAAGPSPILTEFPVRLLAEHLNLFYIM